MAPPTSTPRLATTPRARLPSTPRLGRATPRERVRLTRLIQRRVHRLPRVSSATPRLHIVRPRTLPRKSSRRMSSTRRSSTRRISTPPALNSRRHIRDAPLLDSSTGSPTRAPRLACCVGHTRRQTKLGAPDSVQSASERARSTRPADSDSVASTDSTRDALHIDTRLRLRRVTGGPAPCLLTPPAPDLHNGAALLDSRRRTLRTEVASRTGSGSGAAWRWRHERALDAPELRTTSHRLPHFHIHIGSARTDTFIASPRAPRVRKSTVRELRPSPDAQKGK
ncbi:hypothetical protein B0H17DRAFT_2342 [Mycena rosella]|uniref:Uncharacterized protein n=1 Tax=Mycena rosella TaxID=1033263 RepID=A0AAD7H2M3_MYCRO|nr:hypothetical protein B0H17DRAFT_2342 [Mycena rosella]